MPMSLHGYTVTFTKNRFLGTWHWTAQAPGGRLITPLMATGFVDRAKAEKNALRAIEADAAAESLDGDELRRRVESHSDERDST